MSEASTKKQKLTHETTESWRAKAINKFNLLPVPAEWKDSVPNGSEEAWKRYYDYRVSTEAKSLSGRKKAKEYSYNDSDEDENDDDDDDDYDDDDDEDAAITRDWKWGMEELTPKSKIPWQWTQSNLSIRWDDPGKIRDADYHSHIWSPYAIPHAISLTHYFARSMGWSSCEFNVSWNYCLLDFEEEKTVNDRKYVELCSFQYEADEDGKEEKICTKNMSKGTGVKLRKFLFGDGSKKCIDATCTDMDFWRLILGSMGTTCENLCYDPNFCEIGYEWHPSKEEKKKLFESKAPENDDPEGEVPTSLEEYRPRSISWLMYRVKEITGNIGPVSKYYKPPPKGKVRR